MCVTDRESDDGKTSERNERWKALAPDLGFQPQDSVSTTQCFTGFRLGPNVCVQPRPKAVGCNAGFGCWIGVQNAARHNAKR